MSRPADDSTDTSAALRWGVYAILIAVSTGGMLGRIMAINSVDRVALAQSLKKQGRKDWQIERPFLSGNDRSRLATARALVEHGTYAIDQIVVEPGWDTIDMVKHDDQGRPAPELDEGHLYSSKPPLLATLMAGPYWVVHKLTGTTLGTHPYAVGRLLLVIYNVIPLVIYFWLLCGLAERLGRTDFGRIFVVAAGALGTFLTTFAVVVTNHVPAAVSAAAALLAAVRIVYGNERRGWLFFAAGLFAAFTAASELPALSFFALLALWLALVDLRAFAMAFVPGAALVLVAALGTNYLAHGSLIPPYAHRQAGANWYEYRYLKDGKPRDSYWMHPETRSPIDQGEPSTALYALHVLVGHHGIFSLTPIWLLAAVGVGLCCADRSRGLAGLGWLVAVTSIVCLTFYILRPLDDRNYGGMTSGFRWAFWFAPLWLACMLPAADALAERRWARWLACALLCLSAMSADYPTWNPWVQPWLTDLLLHLDWVQLGAR